ncbi:FtsK/SpoIIIE domain-containing protein [Streptomyces sp. NPDC054933]
MTDITTAPAHIAAALAALAALVLVGMLVHTVVRYLRADTEMRASLRLDWRIRRTWKRQAPMHGLSVKDRTPTTAAQLAAKDGRKPETRELVPKIHTTVDRTGVTVRMRTLAGIGLTELQKAAPYLADTWRCPRISVLPDEPGWLSLRAVRYDPLATTTAYRPDGAVPKDLGTWPVGTDEFAEPVKLPLKQVPGVTVAGLPGYGKTSLINGLICRLAPSDAVQFAVADGKASAASEGDYADTASRLFAFVGDDLADANQLFHRLVKLHRTRYAHIRKALGTTDFWKVGPTPAWPLVVLVIDEAHTYFRDHKGSDPATKKLAALAHENARLVEHLVKKGRSVGILVILATQKATGDALPTFIRDVCPVNLSFAQNTADAAVAALGDDIRKWPDVSPVSLRDPAYVGVASMALPGRVGFTRVRTPYVEPADAARIATVTAHLTRDPATLLPGPSGPEFVKAA